VTWLALFVPSELIEIGLERKLEYAEEETYSGVDCEAAMAD
jgi:hypothetical protein